MRALKLVSILFAVALSLATGRSQRHVGIASSVINTVRVLIWFGGQLIGVEIGLNLVLSR
jgi:hypothetical protein